MSRRKYVGKPVGDAARSRRRFLVTFGFGALAAAPLASFAQQSQNQRRIGVLSGDGSDSVMGRQQQRLFRESLQRLGYEEGKNLVIEWRFAEAKVERLPMLAGELVRANVDLIVAVLSNDAIIAAKRATAKIAIVMHHGFLPVERGLVTSLARPGGNVTGTSWVSPETSAKTLEILKEAAPRAIRVAVFRDPEAIGTPYMTANERVSGVLGFTLRYFDAVRPDDVEPLLAQIRAYRPDALYVSAGPIIRARIEQVVAFANDQKLVSLAPSFAFVNAGGLLSYGPDIPDMWDRTTSYVDRILRGAKPDDLPIEEPRKFLLMVNARTARAIGYKIPQSLLLRADRVIE